MDLNNYLNNLGFQIYNEFKGKTIFRGDIPIPLNIMNESSEAGDALYLLIHDHIRFAELLTRIKITWVGFLNQNILLGISEYETVLIEKINQERIRSEMYKMAEAHKLDTDMVDINDLIQQCSIKHSSIDALAKCMSKSSINKRRTPRSRKKR